MSKVEVRKTENEIHETGQAPSTRTDVSYQIGAEIDGTFVPFATVAQGRVDQAKAAAEAAKENEPAKKEKPPAEEDAE